MDKSKLRVLVVDDMRTMRKLVMRACSEMGISEFIEASDGIEAWGALSGAQKDIHVVISDWNMPNATGLDFLKRVRADARFKKLPFLMLTAESELAQVAEAAKAGVSGYVVKPFTSVALASKIEEVLGKTAK